MNSYIQVWIFIVICGIGIDSIKTEKILFIYPIASKSETNLFLPLAKGLASKGHEITLVTPVNSNNLSSNIKQIVPIKPIVDTDFDTTTDPIELRKKAQNHFTYYLSMDPTWMFERCHTVYQNKEFQQLASQKFDLIIMSGLFQNCFDGMLYKLGAPFILMTSCPSPDWVVSTTGFHPPPSFVPIAFLDYEDEMSFSQRVGNTIMTWCFQLYNQFIMRSAQDSIYRQYLGAELPGSEEIENNVSLIFSYSYPALTYPRPTMPDIIEIGGIHCHPPKQLPQDLEKFVNDAKDGIILFSLGSVIQAHTLPETTKNIFLKVFSRLKQRVLWKWETETMENLPSNVKLSKWLPQQDILGHTNTKLFISHGGLLSTMEAAYHGVPMIGIPFFVDQMTNMKSVQKKGYSKTLEILDLTEYKLEITINQLLKDPKFSTRAKEMSTQFHDQLNSPLERAVYWSEYVMKHKGATHLRSAARKLNFWQYHSVDVVLFIGSAILVILLLTLLLMRKCWNCMFGKSQADSPEEKKQKRQ